jgi:SAM-dependent methyltransferase
LSKPEGPRAQLQHEIIHGSRIAPEAESIWGWASAVGQQRARRRAALLISLGDLQPGKRVLELGCGTGLFTRMLAPVGVHLTSIDISSELLRTARGKSPELSFILADAHELPFAENTFDAVIGSSVLHHLQARLALQEIRRVTRPGGRLAFAEPNMLNPQILLQKNIGPLKRWLGDSPDETAFLRWSLARDLHRAGYIDLRVFPYDFLHPITPESTIPIVSRLGTALEHIPVLREIAGSLMISAMVAK